MPTHGDLASNAAMVLAKAARKKPRDIADKLAGGSRVPARHRQGRCRGARLPQRDVQASSVVGARPRDPQGRHGLRQRLTRPGRNRQRRIRLGQPDRPDARRPLPRRRVRRCAGEPARLRGYKVTREYYINDAGAQVDVLARSAHLRYREALGEKIGEIPEGLYPGEYLKPVGEALAKEYRRQLLGKPESEWLTMVREKAVAGDDGDDQGRSRRPQRAPRRVLLRASLTRGKTRRGRRDDRRPARHAGLIFEGRLEKPKATTARSGRTASRRCSGRPRSATTSIAR